MKATVSADIGWVRYRGDISSLDENKCGKWMFRYSDEGLAANLCREAVEKNVVVSAKYRPFTTDGVACFYLNWDDIETHKKVIRYFLENNMIQKTRDGRLYNMAFKLDTQTRAGEYGSEFKAKITLSDFVNLYTGEWLPKIDISIS